MEKMIESRKRLLLKYGEFSPILLRLELKDSDHPLNLPFRTAYTDGQVLGFFPEWIDKLVCPQCGGNDCQYDTIQFHENMHCALLHCFSQRTQLMREEDLALFFEAEDHIVNNIALEAGFHPIKGWICDIKYSGWTLEETFEDLKQTGRKGQRTVDVHLSSDQSNGSIKLSKEWQKALADALILAKQKGTLGNSLSKLVDETLESQIPWPRIVVDHLQRRLSKCEQTWKRPSRRSRAMGLYLPDSYAYVIECLVFCFDTSGSMWEDPLLSQGFAELKSCLSQINVQRAILIEADTQITREEEIYDTTLLSSNVSGGGGTSFVEALQRAETYNPDLIVYFTDLECDFPQRCESRVLWITRSRKKIPFGEKIIIK